jgi:hypothetical protein
MRILTITILVILLGACSEKDHSVGDAKHAERSAARATSVTTPSSSVVGASSPLATNVANTPQDADRVWVRLSATTEVGGDKKVSADAKKVFAELYGGSVWKDEALAQYFKDKNSGYLAPIFEERFTEGGLEKLLVLGHIAPEPIEEYFCHACVPLLGGAIFLRQGTGWVVESAQKIIGWGDAFGGGRFSVIPIGPAKYGVAIRSSDAHQGYEDLRGSILVPDHGKLNVALTVGYSERPGPGACLDVGLLPQGVNITFEPVGNSSYFDAVVQVQYNDGNCEHSVRVEKTVRYRFLNGKYEPI